MERPTTAADEQRVVGQEPAAAGEAMAEGTTGLPADWYHALSTALAEHAAPTLDQVDVPDPKAGRLAHAKACVKEEQHDRAIALGLLRTCIEGS